MSKSVCFNIGEGFAREGDFYVPSGIINNIRIKPYNGKMMIYVSVKGEYKTYVIKDEIFDLIASQFDTVMGIVGWVDHRAQFITTYCSNRVNCEAIQCFAFFHNGVEHVSSYRGNCCKECQDNSLLFWAKTIFEQDTDVRDVVVNQSPPQAYAVTRHGYDIYIISGSIGMNMMGNSYSVPSDVARLLRGLDVSRIVDIVMEVRCFRRVAPPVTHTSYECQCSDCYSEGMVVRVEAILARMT
jgi:hypothetical protein